MILKMIMKLFDWVAGLLFGLLKLPIFPPQLSGAVQICYEWMGAGMGIIDFFCPLEQIAPAIATFMLVFAAQKVYHLFIWVMSKIPFLGVNK